MTNLSRLRCSHKSMGLCLFLLPSSLKVLSDNLMRVLCTARRQLFKYSQASNDDNDSEGGGGLVAIGQ